MKIRMFQDLEARGKNWHKELLSVLWVMRTNINRAIRDTPFNLVYGDRSSTATRNLSQISQGDAV
jgi:hypothetical protein